MHQETGNRWPAGSTLTAARSAAYCSRLVMCAAYPLVMGLALWAEMPWLEAALLPLAAAVIMAPPLARGKWKAWLALVALSGFAIAAGSLPSLGMWPPAIITACMAAWFGLSLRPGSVPLIRRFANAVVRSRGVDGPGDSRSAYWMRLWTAIWTLMLGAGAAALAWSASTGHIAAWMWLTYSLPVVIAGLLCGEFALRRIFLPEHAKMSLLSFLMALLAADWGDLVR